MCGSRKFRHELGVGGPDNVFFLIISIFIQIPREAFGSNCFPRGSVPVFLGNLYSQL